MTQKLEVAMQSEHPREFWFCPERTGDFLTLEPTRQRELLIITKRAKEFCGDDEHARSVIYDNMIQWDAEPELIARNLVYLGISIESIQKVQEIANRMLAELEHCETEVGH